MLCQTCRRALLAKISSRALRNTIKIRTATTAPATSNAAPIEPSASIALSSSTDVLSSAKPGISQPLSTPHFPSTSTAKTGSASSTKLRGSLPGGAELRGIAYLKAKPHIHAKEDDEYPPWLWRLLDENKSGSIETKADLAALTKKQRAKYDRKQERIRAEIPREIPVHEQSKDLTGPGDNAIVSLERRQEITKSSRVARRKSIREDNFLRGM